MLGDLLRGLTERFARGYSVTNLRNFRQFYLVFQDRLSAFRSRLIR